ELETENKLFNLTQSTYLGDKHRFFVDGTATAGDVYTGSTGGWKTYLVGTLGGGGRSVYVLDITDPLGFTASNIKYEFKDTNNLGFTYGNPIIAHFADDNWYAVFPNGPDSKNDRAGIWLLNLNTGTGTFLDTGSGSSASPNGMMSIGVKVNDKRTVTAIYGGDLQGQVWKYDVFNDTTSKFQSGSPKLLFTAGTGQAITGGIRLGKLPAITGSSLKGTLVFFGTGKYFENVDKSFNGSSVPQTDSLYSVLDEDTGVDNTVIAQTRSNMSSKTLTTSGDYRYAATATTSDVDYKGGKRGWYIDLLNNGVKEGERSVTTPLLFGDRIIFTTLIPSSGDRCLSSGSGWLLEFDPLNGTMLAQPPLDTNGDQVVDSNDSLVAGKKQTGIITEPAVIPSSKMDYKVIGTTNKQKSITVEGESKPPGAGGDASGVGRTSWRQLQ
ncbi:MAG TPA: PilC/PilY family type IV pilus protein, partial [Pseudomonadales bacterium]|nr:PilC/PilY family type IV pilus protein [Pseudomonadales bacterium]